MESSTRNEGDGQGVGRDPRPCERSLLIDVHDVAALLKCSPRHIYRLLDGGLMPGPYKIGALCRWDRAMIEEWVRNGCPSRGAGGRQ